jgi:hypothetical protein
LGWRTVCEAASPRLIAASSLPAAASAVFTMRSTAWSMRERTAGS